MYKFYFLLLLLAPNLLAADPHEISLDKLFLDLRPLGLRITQVVDARDDKPYVGIVQRGPMNRKIPAVMANGLEQELTTVIGRSLSFDKDPPMVLRINKLFLYETTHFSKEVAAVELNISLLRQEGDGYCELFEMGTLYERGGLDATPGHGRNILDALYECLLQYSRRAKAGQLVCGDTVTAADLAHNPLEGRTYRQAGDAAPLGVYHTFTDFRDRKPDTTFRFSIKYQEKKLDNNLNLLVAEPKWEGSNQPFEKEIWGLQTGRGVFIRAGGRFIELRPEGDTWTTYLKDPDPGTAGVVLGSFFGGIIGGLVLGSIDALTTHRDLYRLDWSTGALVPVQLPRGRRLTADVAVVSSAYNPEGAALELEVDGQPLCTLGKGTYHILHLPASKEKVEICVREGRNRTCQTVEAELLKTELLLVILRKNGDITLDRPNVNVRQSLVAGMRKGELEQACGRSE